MAIRRTAWSPSAGQFKPAFISFNAIAYLLLQVRLSLAKLREWRDSTGPTHETVPPAKLRVRVHGKFDKASYLEGGRIVAQNIQDLCKIADRDFNSFTDVLDFGSGCGRVIQNFRDQSRSCTLYA